MKRFERRKLFWIKIRMAILLFTFCGMTFGLVYKASELQIKNQQKFNTLAKEQYLNQIILPPTRGIIYDRKYRELALSVKVDSIYANPRLIKAPLSLSKKLSEILDLPSSFFKKRLQKKKFFVWIKRRILPSQAKKIKRLKIPGLGIVSETKRFYPNKELLGHVLGFSGLDSQGLAGIELSFDTQLKGTSKEAQCLRDALGRIIFAHGLIKQEKTQGNNIVLTIDKNIQYITEQELKAAIQTFEAKSGIAIVMEPNSGEILAMATYPGINPNKIPKNKYLWRNRAITDVFEPGSTFKVFTVAAALDSNTISPEDQFYCEGGIMNFAGKRIRDIHKMEWATVQEIIKESSNIGITKISEKLGKQKLYQYLKKFGFGEKTGISLPGEAKGLLRTPDKWYEIDIATIAFGQGVSVSALQLVTAVSAIANGGLLLKPLIVRQILDPEGKIIQTYKKEVKRRVISETTSEMLKKMMESVTEEGTGTQAAIKGFKVAGKTGTAQKPDLIAGGYKKDAWTSCFIGFVPSKEPKIAMAIIIDEPIIHHYGGIVAAPVFRRIGEKILAWWGITPDSPSLPQSTYSQKQREIKPLTPLLPKRQTIKVPNFHGKTIRRVLQIGHSLKLNIQIRGTGVAVSQTPPPGSLLDKTKTCKVIFKPPK
jgi:cell division protein FtsI (penicillin-binding protein 3)